MANEVIYVRNMRPNGLIIKLNGLKYPALERRGARGDTMALPAEAENDPIVAKFLRTGYLEQVSKEAFFELAARTEDTQLALRTRKHQHASEVTIPMNSEKDPEPYVITDKDLAATANLRTPHLEHERLVSTDVELGFAPDEEEIARQAEIDREVDERNQELKNELDELRAQLAALQAKQSDTSEEESTPRKKASSGTKSTRARSARSKKS